MPNLKAHSKCRNKDCCCDGCEEVRLKNSCCYCIPKWICVSLEIETGDGGGAGSGCFDGCACTKGMVEVEWDCIQEKYVGSVKCGGIVFDFQVFYELDSNDVCQLCLASICAGITEDNPLCVDLTKLSGDSTVCCNFSEDFNVSLIGCGEDGKCLTGNVNISNVRDHFVPIEGCACIEECLCIFYGRELRASTGIPGCPDIPSECLECTTFTKVCYNEYKGAWEFTVTCQGEEITISLVPECNPSECNPCGIRGFSDTIFDDNGGDGGLKCYFGPHPGDNLFWTRFDRTPCIKLESIVVIKKDCHDCLELDSEFCPGCCSSLEPDCPPPRTLTATVVAPGCLEIDGRTATLFPGGGGCQSWTGVMELGTNPGICSPVNFALTFFCNRDDCGDDGLCGNYQLTVGVGNSACQNNADLGTFLNPLDLTPCQCGDMPFWNFEVGALQNKPMASDCACCGIFHIRITA